jgi:hypothetical protein
MPEGFFEVLIMGDLMASDRDREGSNNDRNGNNGNSHSRGSNEEQHVKAAAKAIEINRCSV